MSANELLLWMSAIGHGSWAQFRGAATRLVEEPEGESGDDEDIAPSESLSVHQSLRLTFSRLGFAEFFVAGAEGGWRVAPPVLATRVHRSGYEGIVVGARSPALLRKLESITDIAALSIEAVPQCPDLIRISSSSDDGLVEAAGRLEVTTQSDASLAIAAAVPPIDERATWNAAHVPLGREWSIEEFRTPALRWESCSDSGLREARSGLFRMRLRYRTEVILRFASKTYQVPLQVGKYITLKVRRMSVLRYDAKAEVLSTPAICRPPLLVERALILCSGRLPSYEVSAGSRARVHYHNVPLEVARATASLLRQELR